VERTELGVTVVAPLVVGTVIVTATNPLRCIRVYTGIRLGNPEYMQGASTTEERLRFQWTPKINWETRRNGSLRAICSGWEKIVRIPVERETEPWVFDFWYEDYPKQGWEESFDRWIGNLYQSDRIYLEACLWDWVGEYIKKRKEEELLAQLIDEQSCQ
jgi:hypothetical protein